MFSFSNIPRQTSHSFFLSLSVTPQPPTCPHSTKTSSHRADFQRYPLAIDSTVTGWQPLHCDRWKGWQLRTGARQWVCPPNQTIDKARSFWNTRPTMSPSLPTWKECAPRVHQWQTLNSLIGFIDSHAFAGLLFTILSAYIPTHQLSLWFTTALSTSFHSVAFSCLSE